jgi:hypothetical protein
MEKVSFGAAAVFVVMYLVFLAIAAAVMWMVTSTIFERGRHITFGLVAGLVIGVWLGACIARMVLLEDTANLVMFSGLAVAILVGFLVGVWPHASRRQFAVITALVVLPVAVAYVPF